LIRLAASACALSLIEIFLQENHMHQTLLTRFGSPLERVEKALMSLRSGAGIIVTDDEDRENEGDLIFAAESVTVPQMNMLIRECSGIVCLCITPEKAQALELPLMVQHNTSRLDIFYDFNRSGYRGNCGYRGRPRNNRESRIADCRGWEI
jgi:hypothetical protein